MSVVDGHFRGCGPDIAVATATTHDINAPFKVDCSAPSLSSTNSVMVETRWNLSELIGTLQRNTQQTQCLMGLLAIEMAVLTMATFVTASSSKRTLCLSWSLPQ